MSTFNTPKFT